MTAQTKHLKSNFTLKKEDNACMFSLIVVIINTFTNSYKLSLPRTEYNYRDIISFLKSRLKVKKIL